MRRAWQAFTVGVLLLLTHPSWAQGLDPYQQWIHDNRPDCCDDRDCRPAEVSFTPGGWQVAGARWVVKSESVIRWPFNVPYACWGYSYAGRGAFVRCLLMDVRM